MKQNIMKYILFIEAAIFSFIAWSCIALLPMRSYRFLLGKINTNTICENKNFVEEEIVKNLRNVKQTIDRIVKYLPWGTKCLTQAITGKLMLKRRNIKSVLHLGLKNNDNNMQAHAWLQAENYIITGRKGKNGYRIIQSFY